MQQPLHFTRIGAGMLLTNAFAGDFAGQLMQLEGDLQSLLARHFAIAADLSV